MQLKYYVMNYNSYEKKVKPYNIFNNIHVNKYSQEAAETYLKNPDKYTYASLSGEQTTGFAAFVIQLDGIIRWQEQSRCEYECCVGYAFETDCKNLQKIDCYDQVKPNIEMIAREVLWQYQQYMKGTNFIHSQSLH